MSHFAAKEDVLMLRKAFVLCLILSINSFALAVNQFGSLRTINGGRSATATATTPVVRLVGFRHYAHLSGTVPVAVTAVDDLGISRLELYLDQTLVSTQNIAPSLPSVTHIFVWNSASAVNGKHHLRVKAFDTSGNAETATVIVFSRNYGSSPPTGNRVTVVPAVSYQTMKGWQVSGDTGIIEFINSANHPTWTNATIDDNIALGVNYPRIGIHSGMAETGTDRYGAFLANGQDKGVGNGVALWQAVKDHWRVPVNDNADPNVINPNGFKWSMIDQQMDKVIVPMKAKLAARGEGMFWAVTYVHFSTANQLHVNSPAEYGELILALWQHLQSKYGMVPPALEVFLEPDNDACQVTPAEMAAMIAAARNRLVNAGFAKPYIVAPSTMNGALALQFYLGIKTANPAAATYIDEIGYHRYGAISELELAALRATADAEGKNLSMNEFGGGDVRDLEVDLRIGRVSSWEQYSLAYLNEGSGDTGYHHFEINGSGPYTRTLMKRTKYLQHYYRYIRTGAVMKGVINTNSNFRGLPFQNPNGSYAVVIKALAGGTIAVSGLPPGTYGIQYTEGDFVNNPQTYNQARPNQTISDGQDVVFTMPGMGMVTVYNVNYLNPSTGLAGKNPTLGQAN